MILQAANDLGLDLSVSWLIGDKASDMEAGRAAAVGTLVFFALGAGPTQREQDYWIVPSMAEAITLLASRPAAATTG